MKKAEKGMTLEEYGKSLEPKKDYNKYLDDEAKKILEIVIGHYNYKDVEEDEELINKIASELERWEEEREDA